MEQPFHDHDIQDLDDWAPALMRPLVRRVIKEFKRLMEENENLKKQIARMPKSDTKEGKHSFRGPQCPKCGKAMFYCIKGYYCNTCQPKAAIEEMKQYLKDNGLWEGE